MPTFSASCPSCPPATLVSLRPQGAHASLRAAAKRAGMGFLALSSCKITAFDDAATRAALQQALHAQTVIFTSPNAVRAAAALLPLQHSSATMLAVGSSSARCLRRLGVANVDFPQRADSEGLLALPPLQAIAGRTVALITAANGRGLLQRTLTARGARLQQVNVYQRQLLCPRPAQLQPLHAIAAENLCLALTSAEVLQQFVLRFPAPLLAHCQRAHVIASSARLAAMARQHGFANSHQACGPQPAQLLRTAQAVIASTR